MPENGKKVCFIDQSNIFRNVHSLRDNFKVDYRKLINVLSEEHGEIWDVWMFGSVDEDNPAQIDFYNFIRNELKFNTVVKPIKKIKRKCRNCDSVIQTKIEKGVDVALVSKMIFLMNHYDTALLVSGDGDYSHIVRELISNGKRVEVAAFKSSLSNDLASAAKSVFYLDDILDDIRRDF